MWVATPQGFFSAVQDRDDPDTLRVRCRVRDDAEYLIGRMASLGTSGLRIKRDEAADYLFRVLVPRASFALFLAEEALRIDYGNHKDRVRQTQGAARAAAYQRVWSALADLQELPPYSALPSFYEPWEGLPSSDLAEDDVEKLNRWLEEADERRERDLSGYGYAGGELSAEEADELEAQVEAARRKPSKRKGRKGKKQRERDRRRREAQS